MRVRERRLLFLFPETAFLARLCCWDDSTLAGSSEDLLPGTVVITISPYRAGPAYLFVSTVSVALAVKTFITKLMARFTVSSIIVGNLSLKLWAN